MHHHDCGHASWRVSVSSRRDATQRRLRQAAAGGGRRQQAAAGGGRRRQSSRGGENERSVVFTV